MIAVRFACSAETAYDYLADPRRRPEWQSSLRAVVDVVGEPGEVGQTWTDVTAVGLRPAMRVTAADRPHRWTERGMWRGIEATLTLRFRPCGPEECEVIAELALDGAGLWRPAARLAGQLAPAAVRADLRRAAHGRRFMA